jgi:hypothetical protein
MLIFELVSNEVDVVCVSQNRHSEDGSPMRRFVVAILKTSSFIPDAVCQCVGVNFKNLAMITRIRKAIYYKISIFPIP